MHKIHIGFVILSFSDSPQLSDERLRLCDKAIVRATNLLKAVGIGLMPVDIRIGVLAKPTITDNPFALPGLVRQAYKNTVDFDPTYHQHLLIPAIQVGEHRFFGGAAGCVGCDSMNRLSVSIGDTVTTIVNPTEKKTIQGIAACTAHEIAHVYGASHNDKTPDIMNSHLNLFNDFGYATWTRKDKKAIQTFFHGQHSHA